MIVISQSSVRSNELGVVKPTRVGCSDDIEVFTFTRSKPIVQYDSVMRTSETYPPGKFHSFNMPDCMRNLFA